MARRYGHGKLGITFLKEDESPPEIAHIMDPETVSLIEHVKHELRTHPGVWAIVEEEGNTAAATKWRTWLNGSHEVKGRLSGYDGQDRKLYTVYARRLPLHVDSRATRTHKKS